MKPNLPQRLRAFALSLPDAEEGVACEGTTLEKRTVKVRKKSFVFVGKSDVMLKLQESLKEATALANKKPGVVKVGSNGWVTVKFDEATPVPRATLESWIEESYRLFTGESKNQKRAVKSSKKKSSR